MPVYVLKLKNNHYYVGFSEDVKSRVEQHKSGEGSVWTKLWPVVKVLDENCPHDELTMTIKLMSKHGVNNVRGACFATTTLTPTQHYMIEVMIAQVDGKCAGCGQGGHYINLCPHSSKEEGLKLTYFDAMSIEAPLIHMQKRLMTSKNVSISARTKLKELRTSLLGLVEAIDDVVGTSKKRAAPIDDEPNKRQKSATTDDRAPQYECGHCGRGGHTKAYCLDLLMGDQVAYKHEKTLRDIFDKTTFSSAEFVYCRYAKKCKMFCVECDGLHLIKKNEDTYRPCQKCYVGTELCDDAAFFIQV